MSENEKVAKQRPKLDLRGPFFKPIWRRVLIALLFVAWTLIEYLNDNQGWALVAAAIGVYVIYAQFFDYDDDEEEQSDDQA